MRRKIKFFAGLIMALAMVSGLFAASVYALPTPYIDDGVEDAVGTKDVAQMFHGTQLWIGNQADLEQMGKDGKVGISSKSSSATKAYVIDGNQSIFAINYLNDNMTGDPYKEWCNFWMTHDSNFGLKNSSTYVVSFLFRTYTEWQPEDTVAKLQNFAVVSIRNWRYKGGSSIVDFYIQPNIQSDVTPDQMVRVDDKTTPQNPKNTMSIKKLNENTFSVVCKFVTGVPTTEPDIGNDKWFVSFTFHGPGIVACDNIKVYQSDLPLSSFHQNLPAGSGGSTSKPTSSAKPSTSTPAGGTTSSPAGQDVSNPDTSSEDSSTASEVSESIVSTGEQESSAADSSEATTGGEDGGTNFGVIIAIIIIALVVVAGGGVALYFLVLKKKA